MTPGEQGSLEWWRSGWWWLLKTVLRGTELRGEAESVWREGSIEEGSSEILRPFVSPAATSARSAHMRCSEETLAISPGKRPGLWGREAPLRSALGSEPATALTRRSGAAA